MHTNMSKQPPSVTTENLLPHYVPHNDSQSSHQQILRLVRRIGRTPVLDVGAAQGFLGQMLQRDHYVIDAVEPHPVWAAHAQQYYRHVYHTSIEDAPLPDQTYAIVVCADVLEHTVDPVAVLRQLRRAATPDAVFIISLPNIAHIAARLLLLCGRFPQMERGIFDRTHLHFYTRDTAVEMLHAACFQDVLIRSTPVPLEQVRPLQGAPLLLRAMMLLQRLALLLSPRLFGFQWIIVARPMDLTRT